MAFKLAEAFVELNTKGDAALNRKLNGVKGALAGIGPAVFAATFAANALTGALGKMATLLPNLISQFLEFGQASANEFIKAEQAAAKLEGVLLATGNAALFSSKEMGEMASNLAKISVFGKTGITNAQTILAGFTNIRGDIFLRAQQDVLDLATKMGDLESAAEAVGRALQDPIEGVQGLRRAGIALTAAQEKEIAAFLKAGNMVAAQEVILRRIEARFKGIAKAQANTPSGRLLQAREQLADAREEFGRLFLPVELAMTRIKTALMPLVQKLAEFLEPYARLVANIDWNAAAGALAVAAKGIWEGLKGAFQTLFLPLVGPLNAMREALLMSVKASIALAQLNPGQAMEEVRLGSIAIRDALMAGPDKLLEAAKLFRIAWKLGEDVIRRAQAGERDKMEKRSKELAEQQLKSSRLRGRFGNQPMEFPDMRGLQKAFQFKFLGLEEAIKDLQSNLAGTEDQRRHAEQMRALEKGNEGIQAGVKVQEKIERNTRNMRTRFGR